MAESSPPAREPSAESPTSIDEYLAGFPAEVRDRLQSVRAARGSIQFPFDQPMPLALIGKIVRFRVEQSAQS